MFVKASMICKLMQLPLFVFERKILSPLDVAVLTQLIKEERICFKGQTPNKEVCSAPSYPCSKAV